MTTLIGTIGYTLMLILFMPMMWNFSTTAYLINQYVPGADPVAPTWTCRCFDEISADKPSPDTPPEAVWALPFAAAWLGAVGVGTGGTAAFASLVSLIAFESGGDIGVGAAELE